MAKQRKIPKLQKTKATRISGPLPFNLYAQRHRDRFKNYIARIRGFSNR